MKIVISLAALLAITITTLGVDPRSWDLRKGCNSIKFPPKVYVVSALWAIITIVNIDSVISWPLVAVMAYLVYLTIRAGKYLREDDRGTRVDFEDVEYDMGSSFEERFPRE